MFFDVGEVMYGEHPCVYVCIGLAFQQRRVVVEVRNTLHTSRHRPLPMTKRRVQRERVRRTRSTTPDRPIQEEGRLGIEERERRTQALVRAFFAFVKTFLRFCAVVALIHAVLRKW